MEVKKNEIKVSDLFIYPIKSSHEVNLTQSSITELGLKNDRILVVIHKTTHKFLTIRTHSKLYDIKVEILKKNSDNTNKFFSFDTKINIFIPKEEFIGSQTNKQNFLNFEVDLEEILLDSQTKTIKNVKVWDIETEGYIIENEGLSVALNNYLQDEVLLICTNKPRKVSDYKQKHYFTEEYNSKDSTFFADLAPLLITTTESLDFLNKKLTDLGDEPVKMINFRPNLVLTGGNGEFWEDKVMKIKIGNVVLRRLKGCTRCKVTTFDTEKRSFNKNLRLIFYTR